MTDEIKRRTEQVRREAVRCSLDHATVGWWRGGSGLWDVDALDARSDPSAHEPTRLTTKLTIREESG